MIKKQTSSVGLSADSTFFRFVIPSSSESLDDESALDNFSLASFNSLPLFWESKKQIYFCQQSNKQNFSFTQLDDVFVHFFDRQMENFPQIHFGEFAVHFFGKYPGRNG